MQLLTLAMYTTFLLVSRIFKSHAVMLGFQLQVNHTFYQNLITKEYISYGACLIQQHPTNQQYKISGNYICNIAYVNHLELHNSLYLHNVPKRQLHIFINTLCQISVLESLVSSFFCISIFSIIKFIVTWFNIIYYKIIMK